MCIYVCVCIYIYIYIIYTHNGILLSCKQKIEILPIATTWVDLEIIILSEVNII